MFCFSSSAHIHTHLPFIPGILLLFEWKYVQLCSFSLKDEVIILSPSKCTALTFQSSAMKCKPLTGSDPQESLQCFSFAVKAASVKGGKYIYYSSPSNSRKSSLPPFSLLPSYQETSLSTVENIQLLRAEGPSCDYLVRIYWKHRCASLGFPKSAAPKAEGRWVCWVEMDVPH